jgi:hypothetical protein
MGVCGLLFGYAVASVNRGKQRSTRANGAGNFR